MEVAGEGLNLPLEVGAALPVAVEEEKGRTLSRFDVKVTDIHKKPPVLWCFG
jgi:hypothetical protein